MHGGGGVAVALEDESADLIVADESISGGTAVTGHDHLPDFFVEGHGGEGAFDPGGVNGAQGSAGSEECIGAGFGRGRGLNFYGIEKFITQELPG